MKPEDIDKIKFHHRTSIGGLMMIFKLREFYKKWPFGLSLCLSATISLLYFFICPNKSFNALKDFTDLNILVFPCLLGFSLAGYTIVVGFPNIDLIKFTADVEDLSLYQTLSGFFAIAILLQIITTVSTFVISWLVKMDLNSIVAFHNVRLGNGINIFVLFGLVFFTLYSLLLTPFIVINLFSLSQANNGYLTIKKAKEEDSILK